MTKSTLLDKVKFHLNHTDTEKPKEVEQYDLMLYFRGTYGQKRKPDRCQLQIATIKAQTLFNMSDDEVLKLFKYHIEEALMTFKIKHESTLELRPSGKTIEIEDGFKITKSDSNLMMNAPRIIYDASSRTVEVRK